MFVEVCPGYYIRADVIVSILATRPDSPKGIFVKSLIGENVEQDFIPLDQSENPVKRALELTKLVAKASK